MSILTNIQVALLDSIIKQTKELTSAIEENRESDINRLYLFRSKNMSLLSELKSQELRGLKNYREFLVCIQNFEAKFTSYCQSQHHNVFINLNWIVALKVTIQNFFSKLILITSSCLLFLCCLL